MNRRLSILVTALALIAAACGGGSSTSPTAADALERARDLAAATTIEGGKSIFDYSFPNGRAGEIEPAAYGRSH